MQCFRNAVTYFVIAVSFAFKVCVKYTPEVNFVNILNA
jgi:hypothetical protein